MCVGGVRADTGLVIPVWVRRLIEEAGVLTLGCANLVKVEAMTAGVGEIAIACSLPGPIGAT